MKSSYLCHKIAVTVFLSMFFFCIASEANSTSYPEVAFILDASGSMWGKAGEQTKIEAAKDVMAQIIPSLEPEVKVGLVAYGHRRKGDCTDIEVLIQAGSDDRTALLDKIHQIKPKGKTPISGAVGAVVEQLKTKENETTIVLVSDGIETCAADPCAAVKALKDTGIKFVMHVVGFGVADQAKEQLNCLANAAGGNYLDAKDADSLLTALSNVSKEIEEKVVVEKAKTVQVKAKTGLGKIKLSMPQSTTKGMAGLRILKAADGKQVKATEKLAAESIHPLLAGEYEIEYLFATPNYGQPTVTKLGRVQVNGGETREIQLGAIVFNIADSLKKGTSVEHVSIADSSSGKTVVTVNDNSNGYYNYVPKAVLPGKYDILFHYSNSPDPSAVARNIIVKPNEETVVTLDSGIIFKEAAGIDISGWDLVPVSAEITSDAIEDEGGVVETKPLVQARPPYGNKTTLWMPYIVPPGKYRLLVHVEGMSEPLPVAEELEIISGQTLQFDSGL